ncbi:PAS domain-containing sensor histidine kinase [Methylosinus sp. R-45379]|uniref:histidine kinase dimerization/phospho-acceptor domain-containing protein n=1 Tax=Methylosinus sp. R-45379 TaxID=980563 RepID=UPI0007C94FD4|nr:histidine kinase dimerization/phospho-acceptor domain-containing protein [Methylosinus sp. R-45379]OAI22008.1 PAS domain-containing sensor histidine kinase [Methylosinus sp. R-45379]
MSEHDRIESEAVATQIGADPAFAALEASGAPIVAAAGEPLAIIHANESAISVFGGDLVALGDRLFGGDEPGARRLRELAGAESHAAAPRLERLRFSFGPIAQTATVLCRRLTSEDSAPLFLVAMLGMRSAANETPLVQPAEAPVPEAVIAEPEAVAESRAAPEPVIEPPPARPPRPERFLWRSDAEGRVLDVTAALADVVGRENGDIAGRPFLELASRLRLAPDERLADAFDSRRSWSGVELDWPLDGGCARVPVTLGALPVFDDGRHFGGYQGYGVLHVDRLRQEPEREPEPEPDLTPPPAEEPATALEPLAEAVPIQTAPAETEQTPALLGAKIVPLRPLPRLEEAAASIGESLSPSERTAFDEIARALASAAQKPAKGSVRDLFETIEQATGQQAMGQATAVSAEPAPESEPFEEPSHEAAPSQEPLPSNENSAFPGDLSRAAALLDRLPIGVMVARGAEALYANRTLLDYLGYGDAAALTGDGGATRLFAGRRPPTAADGTAGGVVEVLDCDGEPLEADVRLEPIQWDGLAATLVTLRSAASVAAPESARAGALRKELESRRHEAEELRATLDAMGDAVVVVDAEGRLRSVNAALGRLIGGEPRALLGSGLASLFCDADQGVVADFLRRPTSRDLGDGLQVQARGRNGQVIPVQLTLAPLGPPPELRRCVILHVIRRRSSDDELEAARHEAERASAAKTDFLAKVSHEIRTPLNAIIGFAEVMMEERFGPLGNDRYKEYLKDIHTSGEHVLSLVNDLLDLSKIEAGKFELDVERIDANAVISECVSIMQPQANRSRVVIRLSLWPRLPRILADGRSLRQILLNLLSNAVKFNEAGGQVIVSSALTDAGYVVIRVKDTGIGMSENEIETALEPFRQIGSSRGGTGLGLPVTKALIEANRASFSIKSRKNQGTLIEVAFPPPQVLAAE